MALVQMKCPNCGGQMQPQGGAMSFKCPHCGTTVLNIVEAKLDSDVTIMTPEEFEQKANENRKSLVVKFDDRLEEIDVDTTVINKKIKDATVYFENCRWDRVKRLFSDDLALSLKPKWEGLPSVCRLLLLSNYEVKDESELLIRSINLAENEYYIKLINSPLCDTDTKNTYIAINEICNENIKIDAEIVEGYKLLEVGATEQFIAYAKAMCNKYPFRTQSWLMLAEAYDYDKKMVEEIFSIIQKCPDFKFCQEYVVSGYGSQHITFRLTEKMKDMIYNNDVRVINRKKAEQERKNKEARHNAILNFLPCIPLILVIGFCVFLVFTQNLTDIMVGTDIMAYILAICVFAAVVLDIAIIVGLFKKFDIIWEYPVYTIIYFIGCLVVIALYVYIVYYTDWRYVL